MEKAKIIYIKNLGNKDGMRHNGELEEYKKYSISSEQESIWRNELIQENIKRLDPNNLEAANNLFFIEAIETIPEIIQYSDKGTSFTQLLYAQILFDLSTKYSSYSIPFKNRLQAFKKSQKIATDLLKSKKMIILLNNDIENLRKHGIILNKQYIVKRARIIKLKSIWWPLIIFLEIAINKA